MLTVTVDCVASGNSRTCSPLGSRYSVMPSTVRTLVARASVGLGAVVAATAGVAAIVVPGLRDRRRSG